MFQNGGGGVEGGGRVRGGWAKLNETLKKANVSKWGGGGVEGGGE